MDPNCTFCQIVDCNEKQKKGEATLTCYPIYETRNILAFLDNNPLTEGHTLVVPKKHARTVWELSPQILAELFEVCRAIEKRYSEIDRNHPAYLLIIQHTSAEGQRHPHAHIHILPNTKPDFSLTLLQFIQELRKRRKGSFVGNIPYQVQQKYKLRYNPV